MASTSDPRAARIRGFNPRLSNQYGQMLLLVWMGAKFEGDALLRWNRLRVLYARSDWRGEDDRGNTPPDAYGSPLPASRSTRRRRNFRSFRFPWQFDEWIVGRQS